MEKIFDRLAKVLDKIIGIFLIVIVAVTFLQVLFRYFVNKPLMWTEELARAFGVWMVMLGAALAQKENRHIGLEVLPERISWLTPWLTEIVVLVFTGLLLGPSFQFFIGAFGQRAYSMPIPMSIFFASMPIGIILLMIVSIIKIILKVFRIRGRG